MTSRTNLTRLTARTAVQRWRQNMSDHMKKVEFIESYIKRGNDYQWNDNHGELIRCNDCKYFEGDHHACYNGIITTSNGYCHYADRKGKDDTSD